MSSDFIPLHTGKPVVRGDPKKIKRKSPSSGAMGGPGPASKKRNFVDNKLRDRMVEYLRRNREKAFIDPQEMAKQLQEWHPEYRRIKFRQFCRQVEGVLDSISSDPSLTGDEHGTNKASENGHKSTPRKQPVEVVSIDEDGPNGNGDQKQTEPAKPEEEVEQKPTVAPIEQNKAVLDKATFGLEPVTPSVAPVAPKTPKRATANGIKQSAVVGSIEKPEITINDIAGCQKASETLFDLLGDMVDPEDFIKYKRPFPRGALIHGPPGCGKKMLAKAAAGTYKLPLLSVSASDVINGISGESEARIRDVFERAKAAQPCVVLIDKVDLIAKPTDRAEKDMEVRMTSQLASSLGELNARGPADPDGNVFVVGVTTRLEGVDASVRQRFKQEIAMGMPDADARRQILELLCKSLSNLAPDVDLDNLSKLTPGFVGHDLEVFIDNAFQLARAKKKSALRDKFSEEYDGEEDVDFPYGAFAEYKRNRVQSSAEYSDFLISMSDLETALKQVTPTAMKEGFATVPDVTFDDVGALDDIRRELMSAVVDPAMHPRKARRYGLNSTPRGALLWGPPGCGKTMVAKAVANQAGINFISVKGPELINMYLGESERAIRQVFQRARNSAPCVIFFDEIDSICPRRSGGSSGGGAHSNRLVNQLLTELDGVQGREGVYVMGATNRPDMIDEAILRPGRLTKAVYVGFPSAEGRLDILRKLTKQGTDPALSADVDLKRLAESPECDSFTGADLNNLVQTAGQLAFDEDIGGAGGAADDGKEEVQWRHFQRALEAVKGSVDDEQKRRFERLRRKYAKGVVALVRRETSEKDEGEDGGKAEEAA